MRYSPLHYIIPFRIFFAFLHLILSLFISYNLICQNQWKIKNKNKLKEQEEENIATFKAQISDNEAPPL